MPPPPPIGCLSPSLPQLLHAPFPLRTLPPPASPPPPGRQGALSAAHQRARERLPPHHGVTSGGANFLFRPPRCRQLPLQPLPPNPGNARALGLLPVRAGGGRVKERPGLGAAPRLLPARGGIRASRYPSPPPVPVSPKRARGPGNHSLQPRGLSVQPNRGAPLASGSFLCSGLRPFPLVVPRCWVRGLQGTLRFPQRFLCF